MSTTDQHATIRNLIRQDRALDADDPRGRLELSGAAAIQGWRRAAGEAGDTELIEALDAMGDDVAARIWEEEIEARRPR